jgi:hypothetical protein
MGSANGGGQLRTIQPEILRGERQRKAKFGRVKNEAASRITVMKEMGYVWIWEKEGARKNGWSYKDVSNGYLHDVE